MPLSHDFTCGCIMNEGDLRSTHASGDYADRRCDRHKDLPTYVWPHHVGDDTQRIAGEVDVVVGELVDGLVLLYGKH